MLKEVQNVLPFFDVFMLYCIKKKQNNVLKIVKYQMFFVTLYRNVPIREWKVYLQIDERKERVC